ncbi:hypothetical protein StrepF001_00780 [Streptomyces sp. F001]|nr:hypothetical protein StrepF001_00780 [Streptomyces sp. F001]
MVASMRAGRSMWLSGAVVKLADTSAQVRVRLTMALIVGLSAVALHLGFEAILGAFIAGAVLRLVDPDAERNTRSSTSNWRASAMDSSSRCSS